MNKLRFISSHIATIIWNIMFGYGLLSILYGYFCLYKGQNWVILDDLVKFAGFALTILSVMVVCFSIYVKNDGNAPSLLSKYISAPLVLLLMLAIAIEAIFVGRYPHEGVLTGASLMGLSGALHRIIPKIHEKDWRNKPFQ